MTELAGKAVAPVNWAAVIAPQHRTVAGAGAVWAVARVAAAALSKALAAAVAQRAAPARAAARVGEVLVAVVAPGVEVAVEAEGGDDNFESVAHRATRPVALGT